MAHHVVVSSKTCLKCGSSGHFWKNKEKSDGLAIYCVSCSKQMHLDWRTANPEKAKSSVARWKQDNPERVTQNRLNWALNNPEKSKASYVRKKMKRYGMVAEDWQALFDRQRGLCAICALPMKATGRSLDGAAVDHDHATGRVRGLLHNSCNKSIGLLKEDPSQLRLAADYLDKNHALRKDTLP